MRRLCALLAIISASACAKAQMSEPDAHGGRPDAHAGADAEPGTPDAPEDVPDAPAGTPDAATPVPDAMIAPTATLLLSEVSLAPTTGELIEVYNPTAAAVTLTNYYVTDVPSYFRLPSGGQTIDTNDFIARFPAGATIAPGDAIVIALDTTGNFTTQYGAAPDYSIADGAPMIVTATGAATLTNTGEPVVLFYWDGASDRVADVDIVIAGAPSAANVLQDKSGVALDGPDADSTTTAYATDARTIPTTSAPASGKSIKRILLETGHETQTGGGNGLSGDDETSEQIGTTWDSTYTVPSPGTTTL